MAEDIDAWSLHFVTLKNPSSMQIVVVGAGIVGASIAFHLSRRGAHVTVLDKARPGDGASGKSFAWINSFGKEPAHYGDFNHRSLDMWDRFGRRLNHDIGLRWGGRLTWTNTADEAEDLRQRVGLLNIRGYATRMVDEAEMRRLEPGLTPGPFTAAAINDNEGMVEPPKVVDACPVHVTDYGGQLHANTEVTGFDIGPGNRIESIQTSEGSLPCDLVILAAGVDTTQLAVTVGVDVPQERSPAVVIRTDPQPTVLKKVPVIYAPPVEGDHRTIELRQGTDGVFMIGDSTRESEAEDDSQKHADDLLRRTARFIPALSNARAIPVPVGFRPMPVDGHPILGFTDLVPNLYLTVMHSGVTLAPLVGELSATEIVDGTKVDMFEPYRLRRFRE